MDIFCQIVAGRIPAVKLWEDKDYLAFLDINPNREGQALVIPKKHFDSDIAHLPDNDISGLFVVVKKTVIALKKGLEVDKVAVVVEGRGVAHMHVKLFPLYQMAEGHLTTELGLQKSMVELDVVAEKIRKYF